MVNMVTYLNNLNYNREVTSNKKRVIILFASSWCIACEEILPKYERWAEEYADQLEFKVIDIAKNKHLVKKFDVATALTFIIMEGKTVITRFAGIQTDETFKYFITRA